MIVAVPLATALKATVAVLSVGQEVSTLAMTFSSFDTLMSMSAELPPTMLKVPVKYIGLGEKMEDLQLFNKREFVDSLFKTND